MKTTQNATCKDNNLLTKAASVVSNSQSNDCSHETKPNGLNESNVSNSTSTKPTEVFSPNQKVNDSMTTIVSTDKPRRTCNQTSNPTLAKDWCEVAKQPKRLTPKKSKESNSRSTNTGAKNKVKKSPANGRPLVQPLHSFDTSPKSIM